MRCAVCHAEIPYAAVCPKCGGGQSLNPDSAIPAHRLSFHGEGGELFPIFIRGLLLSIVTLGVYSFWLRADLRRYLFSHLELEGDRFDYHGTGKELCLGFLRALPILILLVIAPLIAVFMIEDPVWSVLSTLGLYLGVMILIPGAMALSWRYRTSRTSWRGVRFSWRGSVGRAYREAAIGGLITFASLGICYPLLQARMRRVLVGNTYFGNLPFQYAEDGSGLIGPRLVAALLTYPTLGMYWCWFRAREKRYIASGTTVGDANGWSDITGGQVLGYYVRTGLLLLLTLGLAWPWAAVQGWQLMAETTSLQGAIDLDHVAQEAQQATAGGDAIEGVIDADISGIDVGF